MNLLNAQVALLFVLASLSLTGCSGNATSLANEQSLANQHISLMNEMTATLKTVKDAGSAKAAIPKLHKIVERAKQGAEALAALKLSDEAKKKLELAMKKPMEDAETQMMKQMAPLMKLQATVPEVQQVMDAMLAFVKCARDYKPGKLQANR